MAHETKLSIYPDRDGIQYSASFQSDYFAQGSCRLAFQGVLKGNGPRDNSNCVIKVCKTGIAQHFFDLAASKMALEFANQFICILRNIYGPIELEFIIPLIAEMQNIAYSSFSGQFPIMKDERYVKLNELVAIEPYISGEYKKFNSNGGYEDCMHGIITAFCHWTWTVSGHKFMVCDLQGDQSGNKYILTDPAIHSYDRSFGITDLGTEGMKMVLGNHMCNDLCRALRLINPMTGVYVKPGPRCTTYSFQVT